jgi:starch synthase
VLILPWGNVIEDYLDDIGVTLREFVAEGSGGWMFGYVDALRSAGVAAVVVCVSRDLARPEVWRHGASGAEIVGLPQTRTERALRRALKEPYASGVSAASAGASLPARLVGAVAWNAVGYAATPLRPLLRLMRERDAAAMICQEYEYERFDACVVAGARVGVPVFATYQGGDAHYTHLQRLVRPRTIRRAAGLIIPSRTEAARVTDVYDAGPGRVIALPNPLDTEQWAPATGPRRPEGLAIDPPGSLVVWHGRMVIRRKGLDVLLHAWTQVERTASGKPPTLLMIGDGPDGPAVEALVATLGLQHVHLVRRYVLDQAFLRRHLQAADLAVLPSRHEGFAVAPLEAMACGTPVVASDVSGVRDLLPDGEASGGRIVVADDPGALASGILALLRDPALRRAMGDAARRQAVERFSLAAFGARLRDAMAVRGARFTVGPPSAGRE